MDCKPRSRSKSVCLALLPDPRVSAQISGASVFLSARKNTATLSASPALSADCLARSSLEDQAAVSLPPVISVSEPRPAILMVSTTKLTTPAKWAASIFNPVPPSQTLRRWCRDGRIAGARTINGRWYVPEGATVKSDAELNQSGDAYRNVRRVPRR